MQRLVAQERLSCQTFLLLLFQLNAHELYLKSNHVDYVI